MRKIFYALLLGVAFFAGGIIAPRPNVSHASIHPTPGEPGYCETVGLQNAYRQGYTDGYRAAKSGK